MKSFSDQKRRAYAQSQGMKLSDKPKPMNDVEKRAMTQDQAGGHDAALGKVLTARQGMPNAPAEVSAMLQDASSSVPRRALR